MSRTHQQDANLTSGATSGTAQPHMDLRFRTRTKHTLPLCWRENIMAIKTYKDKMVHSNKTTKKTTLKDSSRSATGRKTNPATVGKR